MPIYGDVSDLPLHLLLQALMRAGQTGRLVLRTSADEITIVLDRGRVTAVLTSDAQLRLGQVLRQQGVISDDQLEQALALQAVSLQRRRLGEIFVELGFVSHHQIKRALAQQFEEALVRVLMARDASFAFVPELTQAPEDASILDDQPATMLILNAVRRADELMTPLGLATRVSDPNVFEQLSSQERDVLIALLEGARTLRQVAQVTGLDVDAVRDAVQKLRQRGLVTSEATTNR